MINKQKGCLDLYGDTAKKWQYVNKLIDNLMEKYNYNFIRTPIFEASELFHRGIGEGTDVVTKETYDFLDRGERNITLRPEGTAGVVRSYIENKMYGDATQPVKLYYNGTMYRYERPQSGRDREFTQFGVEVIGSDDPLIDAEVISIPVMLLRLLGLKGVKVKINSLGDQESRDNYRKALLDYFKPHLKDLCEDCNERFNKNPLRILDCKVDKDKDILKKAPKTIDYLNEESKKRFELVQDYLNELEIEYEIDSRLVRGLDYYNHTVFEIEASVEGFGSNNVLAGGGRYNGLVDALGGPKTPGIGFACGIGRIIQALDLEEIKLPYDDRLEVFVMYVSETEKKYAASLINYLRASGFKADTEYTGRSLKSQFNQADRLKAKYLIILNDEDLKNDEVKIKNNKTKEEELVGVDYLLYYLDEHLSDEEFDDIESYEEHGCGCGDPDCDCDEHEHVEHKCKCGEHDHEHGEHKCKCGHKHHEEED